jgi:hypothetical protein
MIKTIFWDRLVIGLLILSVFIKVFSLNKTWVENYYTYGIYPVISKFFRLIFGWTPFSIGDILYAAAFIYLLFKIWKLIRLLFQKKLKKYLSWIVFRKYLKLVLWIYIIFNLFWGLNYDRQGIAKQLQLEVKAYNAEELFSLAKLLQQRLNTYALQIDSLNRLRFDKDRILFRQGIEDYQNCKGQYPFLKYSFPSIKASLYGKSGKYFGYTGYYNPFTAEAQLKTSIPVFMKPFVLNHEIAHQLGYAKENEASFVSFLICKNSNAIEVRYAAYYELFFDAFYQFLPTKNVEHSISLIKNLDPRVLKDKKEEAIYHKRNRNFVAPIMTEAYDKYLKLNSQPKGMATYNEVIAWLIAYMKKYGEEAI